MKTLKLFFTGIFILLFSGTIFSQTPSAPTNIRITQKNDTQLHIEWDKPAGYYGTDWDGVVLFAYEGASVDADVSDNTISDFTANTAYGNGTQDNNSFCVAKITTDNAGSFDISGLTYGKNYYFKAWTYCNSCSTHWSEASVEAATTVEVAPVEHISGIPQDGKVTLNFSTPQIPGYNPQIVIIARENAPVDASLSKSNLDNLLDATSLSTANADWSSRDNTNDMYDICSLGPDNTNYLVYSGDLTQTSVEITGLTNGNTYYFRIFAADASIWSKQMNVSATAASTTCSDVINIPIFESFEHGGNMPDCWEEVDVNGSVGDIDVSSGTAHPSGGSPYDGNYLAYFNSYSVSSYNSTRLTSPPLSSIGKQDLNYEFALFHETGYSSSDDRITVEWSTDKSTWHTIETYHRYNGTVGWEYISKYLPSDVGNLSTFYISFLCTSDYGNDLHFDAIRVIGSTGVRYSGKDTGEDHFSVNSSDNIMYRIDVYPNNESRILNNISTDIYSGANNLDQLISNFKIYISTDSILDASATLLGTIAADNTTSQHIILSGLNQNLSASTYYYIYITADILSTAPAGDYIAVENSAISLDFQGFPIGSGDNNFQNEKLHYISGNSNSDIVLDSNFAFPQNINFINYLSSDIQYDDQSLEIAQFIIRDGGDSTDIDTIPTILTDLVLEITNSSRLNRIAIYDGSTEIAETNAAANVNFGSLNLTANDDSTKIFTIRATFNSTQTDNSQFQLKIISATADFSGSTFKSPDAGGAETPITEDINRIEVIATTLYYSTQPNNTEVDKMMLPIIRIVGRDLFGNMDDDFCDTVYLTSSGQMYQDTLISIPEDGWTSFPIIHTQAGTGLQLSAFTDDIAPVLSNSFDITGVEYQAGDWRPKQDSVDFADNGTQYWEMFDGTNWVAQSNGPQNASVTPDRIIIDHKGITAGNNTSYTYNDIYIIDGGELIINEWADNPSVNFVASLKYLRVYEGGILNIKGNMKLSSAHLHILYGGKMILNNPNLNYTSFIWGSNEYFEINSTVEVNNWDWTSELIHTKYLITRNNLGYNFGNLIINKSTGDSSTWAIMNGQVGSEKLAYNKLEINNSTPSTICIVSSSQDNTITNGAITVNSGNFAFSHTTVAADLSQDFIINGDFQYIPDGTLSFHTDNSTQATNLYSDIQFSGDITINHSASLTNTLSSGNSVFTIDLTGEQPQNIDIAQQLEHTNITVNSGSDTRWLNDLILKGYFDTLRIAENGTFELMAEKKMTAGENQIFNNGGSSGFILNADSTGYASLIQEDDFEATIEYYFDGNYNLQIPQLSEIEKTQLESVTPQIYDETTDDFWGATYVYGTTGFSSNLPPTLSAEQGLLYPQGSSQMLEFTGGLLTSSDKTFDLNYTEHSGSVNVIETGLNQSYANFDGWNIVGNPYASSIDATKITYQNTDKCLITATNNNLSYFYCYNGDTISLNGASRYIDAGKGFWVKANSASPQITIPANARIHTQETTDNQDFTITNSIKISLEDSNNSDQILIRTSSENGVTEYHDDFDVYKIYWFGHDIPQLFSLDSINSMYAINTVIENSDTKIIPLGYYVPNSGSVNISTSDNTFNGTYVYLRDNETGNIIDVATDTSYTFTANEGTTVNKFDVILDKNDAPVLVDTIDDIFAMVGDTVNYDISEFFEDNDFNDTLTFSAILFSGDSLPENITFDGTTFHGTAEQQISYHISVTATDKSGLTVSDDFYIKFDIENINSYDNLCKIYPNPASSTLNIDIDDNISNAYVEIISETGIQISREKITDKHTQIDISSLAAGYYTITIFNNGFITHKKLIIK